MVLVSSLAGPQMLAREHTEIQAVLDATTKPLLVYSYTQPGPESVDALVRSGLAWYTSPARAARAAAALVPTGSG